MRLLFVIIAIVCIALCHSLPTVLADDEHVYADGAPVILWANKVGPYHKSVRSPSENRIDEFVWRDQMRKGDHTNEEWRIEWIQLEDCAHHSWPTTVLISHCSLLSSLCLLFSPSESYPFYSIPGCPQVRDPNRPLQTQPDSFGVLLEGDTLTDTGIAFPFKREQQFTKICDLKLDDQETVDQLKFIVQNHYWYHMLLDELPLFGMVGEYISAEEMQSELAELTKTSGSGAGDITLSTTPQAQGFLYTHRDFSIAYNGQQVIEVNLTSENPRPLKLGEIYPMTYSVTWQATTLPFEDRFQRYLDFDFFEHQIHWFSIMNSFMLVVFLCGLVLLILSRTIKTSVNSGLEKFVDSERGGGGSGSTAGYRTVPVSPTTREIDALGDEIGWKLLLGDVFRAPKNVLLYSVLLGTGVQLFLLVFAVLFLGIAVSYYDESRGLLVSLFLIFYSLTSGIQGYVSSSYYKLNGGLQWKKCMLIGAGFYPSILLTILIFLNTIAVNFGSHGLLSAGAICMLILVWMCVSIPLTIAGTILARSHTQAGAFPCRVNAIKRLIPSENIGNSTLPLNPNSTANEWYTNWWLLLAMSGILPFGSVFIEIYFVFTSFWNYKFYYVYGFMFLVFLILLIVTICVSIVSTYILLNSEDYRWHWLAFSSSASSSIYIFLYSIYFFMTKTHMEGILQTSYYFSYVGVVLLTLALITGSVGAIGTRMFITKIYSYTKAD